LYNAGISENSTSEKGEKVAAHYGPRIINNTTWLQWANNIIFLFLHPQIGNRDTHRTVELTGVEDD